MTTLSGSPIKANNNAFLDRYVQNLSGEQAPELKALSPSKINSSGNLIAVLNGTSESLTDNKENSPPKIVSKFENKPFLSPRKLQQPTLKPGTVAPPQSEAANEGFDVDGLSPKEKGYYEFLCRVGEVKRWIEQVIGVSLPSELELCAGDGLRNGVYLALVTQKINPELAPNVYPPGEKLQFKHTQNINAFFSLVDHVGLPNSFKFELQDLYNLKNLPQVFETLYILITIINKRWPTKTPLLQSVSGKLSFSKDELRKCQRSWPRIRDFKSLCISPVVSPIRKNTHSTPAGGLIKDFKTFDKSIQNDPPILKTPEKKVSLFENLKLSPPSETRALFASPPQFGDDVKTSPSKVPRFKPTNDELLSSTPHLEYSPLKNLSLSYYSPSISRYLTYDTDFYMRRSQAREKNLESYQSFKYGPFDYSPKRKQKMTEAEFLEKVVHIQGICRAVNLRFDFHIRRNLLKMFGREILQLQSSIRAVNVRSSSAIQAHLKFNEQPISKISLLQATAKGILIREELDMLRIKLFRQEHLVEDFQRFSHAIIVRRNAHIQLNNIFLCDIPLRKFQALIRGMGLRSRIYGEFLFLNKDVPAIEKLQSFCKGFLVRKIQAVFAQRLTAEVCTVIQKMQTTFKGCYFRSSMNFLMICAEKQDSLISHFSACLRGNKTRRSMQDFLYKDCVDSRAVNFLQALVRGILVRYALDLVDEFVEYNNLDELQARLRGYGKRSKMSKRSSMFLRNVRSVMMLQSKIRMHLQRRAYLDLMNCPNPSLWCVRKFSHLLNNIGTIEEVQNKLEGCQAQLDAENQRKEKLEKNIRQQLDTAEVLEKYQLDNGVSNEIGSLTIPKCRYPSFEKLFYLLQVDPSYWKTMYTNQPEFVERNVYVTFSTVNQRMGEREKVYFIRFVAEILQLEMAEALSVEEFLISEDHFWMRLLTTFLQREYPQLFTFFLPLLKYVSDPANSFESDPYIIYRSIHNIDPQNRPKAIEDERTKLKFIENLRCLWHSIEMVAELLTRRISEIPLEVRFLCTKIFCYAADKNAAEMETMRAISMVLVKSFISEYLTNSSHYGFQEICDPETNRKIGTVMQALSTVFGLGQFSGYYDPLNQYADEMNSQIRGLLFNVLLDPKYEQESEKLIYHDMISASPRLEILTEKVLTIALKFQENVSNFSDEDVIHDVLKKLPDNNSLPKTGRVVLDLTPAAYKFLVSDDRMRKVYDQVKRAFIYMMQVEEVNTNLYELAVSCVLPQDEPIFKVLLDSNPRIRADPMIQTLEPLLYFNLKNETLKKINELEHMGVTNPASNRLQNFLNDIANTIKNPHYATDYVTQELKLTQHTLRKISGINHKLEDTLNHSKKSIDHAIKALQNTKTFRPAQKSALGNLKGAYKLVQHKKSSELNGLKFKWTTRQLYERGIIKSIENEKLAEQKVKVFGSSGPKFPDITFKLSTSDGAKFGIQLLDKRKGPEKIHSDLLDSFDLRDLLNTQVGSKVDTWYLLNAEVAFNTSALLQLIVTVFLKRETQT